MITQKQLHDAAIGFAKKHFDTVDAGNTFVHAHNEMFAFGLREWIPGGCLYLVFDVKAKENPDVVRVCNELTALWTELHDPKVSTLHAHIGHMVDNGYVKSPDMILTCPISSAEVRP